MKTSDPEGLPPTSGLDHLLSGPRPFIALALLQVAVALLVWSPFPAGVWHDDGVYLLLGRALAEGEGLGYHGVAGAYPAPKFPPLYPLTLAGIWALFPNMGAVTLSAGILNLAFLVGGCLLFFVFLRSSLGVGAGAAAGLSAVAWAPVPLWRSALVPFSEPLFLILATAGLVLACRYEARGPWGRKAGAGGSSAPGPEGPVPDGAGRTRSRPALPEDPWPWHRTGDLATWLLLIGTLLFAIHVRTVGVALVGAVFLVLLTQGRRRAAAATLATVGVGMLPWIVWSSRANGRIPDVLRDVLGSYGPWLLEQMTTYPGAYLAGLHVRALDILDRVLTILLPAPLSWEAWLGDLRLLALVLFVPAFLLGLDRIWARTRTPILFLFLYLVVIWLWPFQATRLLVPLIPLLVLVVSAGFFWSRREGAVGFGTGAEVERIDGELEKPVSPKLIRGWRGVGAAWLVLFMAATAWNLGTGRAGAGYRINAGALARTVEAVEGATPAGAVVGAPEFWAAIPLHSGRTAAPSARFLPVRSGEAGPSWGTPAEQHRIWAITGVDHLVLEQGGTIHGRALDAVVEECGPASVATLASWPEGRLVRLAWDAACRERLGVP